MKIFMVQQALVKDAGSHQQLNETGSASLPRKSILG